MIRLQRSAKTGHFYSLSSLNSMQFLFCPRDVPLFTGAETTVSQNVSEKQLWDRRKLKAWSVPKSWQTKLADIVLPPSIKLALPVSVDGLAQTPERGNSNGYWQEPRWRSKWSQWQQGGAAGGRSETHAGALQVREAHN